MATGSKSGLYKNAQSASYLHLLLTLGITKKIIICSKEYISIYCLFWFILDILFFRIILNSSYLGMSIQAW